MDEIIRNLKTYEECIRFVDKYSELIQQARQKAIELKVNRYENISIVEKELLKAIYAYEEILTKKNHRRTSASRTWQMVKRYGIIGAAEKAVNRKIDATGYIMLVEMGLKELTFEEIIIKYPDCFSVEAVRQAQKRTGELIRI